MLIKNSANRPHTKATVSKPAPAKAGEEQAVPLAKDKKEGFWSEVFSGELSEMATRFTDEHLGTVTDAAESLGEGLGKTWHSLKDKVSNVLDIPESVVKADPESMDKMASVVVKVAKGLGFAAAGVQGFGGIYKLTKGVKEKDTGKKIGGIFDITMALAVGTTVAGLPMGPLVLGPVAAAMGVARGSYNGVKGFKTGDTRKEVQGLVDGTRSLSVGLKFMGQHSSALGMAGAILSPVVGAIQMTRGFIDLSTGLEVENKEKQIRGITDMAAAVGLVASATGIGTIPGIALLGAAMGARVLYQFSDKFQAWTDKRLDKWEPTLKRGTKVVEAGFKPIIGVVRPWVEKLTGWKHGSQKPTEPPADAPDPPSDASRVSQSESAKEAKQAR